MNNTFSEILTQILSDALEKSEAQIEISVNGTSTHMHVKGNQPGLLIAANALIVKMSKESGMPYENILRAVRSVHDMGIELVGDSREQVEVMEKILEKQLENEQK